MNHQEAINLFTKKIREVYGDRLVNIILYGSMARNEQDQESDIDLLVLLKDYKNYWDELHQIGDIEFEINSYFGFKLFISAIPALLKDFQKKKTPLFLNIKREGISV